MAGRDFTCRLTLKQRSPFRGAWVVKESSFIFNFRTLPLSVPTPFACEVKHYKKDPTQTVLKTISGSQRESGRFVRMIRMSSRMSIMHLRLQHVPTINDHQRPTATSLSLPSDSHDFTAVWTLITQNHKGMPRFHESNRKLKLKQNALGIQKP